MLAIQGDTVSVTLQHGRVRATAVGPAVPLHSRFPPPPSSPCTFVVALTGGSGVIQLSPAAFTFVDELGLVHHPQVTGPGGGPPPERVLPGQTVLLTVRGVLPTGNGALTWAPDGEPATVAWDFSLEID